MGKKSMVKSVLAAMAAVALAALVVTDVSAHCDTLNGPVIQAAKKALDLKNVNLVLIWVQKGGEREITAAFNKAVESRIKGGNRDAADKKFFETLVRVHRAGEGAQYMGLKEAGGESNPAVEAADRSIESGKSTEVAGLLAKTLNGRVGEYFSRVTATKDYAADDVPSGRKYVKAYVEYVHFVEGLYDAMTKEAHHQHGDHGNGHGSILQNALLLLMGFAAGMGLMHIIKRKKAD